jgi:hypothetical protein
MTFLEMKSEFEVIIEQYAEFKLLELWYVPYAFGSGFAVYHVKDRNLKILYNGKDFVMIVSIYPPHVKYPSKDETEIFYDSFNELLKKLPEILKSNFP